MSREEEYIDQLFQDHFEGFGKSPSDEVWKGVMANGTMANGKRFVLPAGWKSGATLMITVLMSVLLMSGSDGTEAIAEDLRVSAIEVQVLAPDMAREAIDPVETKYLPESQSKSTFSSSDGLQEVGTSAQSFKATLADHDLRQVSQQSQSLETTMVAKSGKQNTNNGLTTDRTQLLNFDFDRLLRISHIPVAGSLTDSTDHFLTKEARRNLKRGLFGTTYFTKDKGGEWFVSGGAVLVGNTGQLRSSLTDGLVFGAGKYINSKSFLEVALRGTFGQGFSMRATYNRLLLPGKIRPYLQAGLAWDTDLDLRFGAGVLYERSPLSKWRIFTAVSYEKGSQLFDSNTRPNAVIELGVQLRLSGTEPILSDNNWMNSIPHYTVPDNWYLEGSSNFAFFEKTKVTRISAYAGKYISRRLFVRGGVRLGRDRVILPAHIQYHMIARQKLRFGVYAGPSLDVTDFRLGAELGLIAYYEVIPNWSLFVAPVILENSSFEQRIFETGVRFTLGKKKK